MKQERSKRSSQRYFPKHYAPAEFLAEQKRSQSKIGQLSLRAQKKFQALSHASLQKLQTLSRPITKSASTHKSTKAPTIQIDKTANRHPVLHPPKPPKRKSLALTWREGTLLSIIGISAVTIAFTLIYSAIFDPSKLSQRELEKLANAYYVEYLYPHALGKYLDEPAAIMSEYKDAGLPIVRLRQLLLYNNGQFAASADKFSNQYYECDSNQTFVRYYPVEPYGPRDYTIKYGSVCEKVGAI